MMPDAHGQKDLARCGFEALDGHPCDPVFQERIGFFILGHEPHEHPVTQCKFISQQRYHIPTHAMT